MKDSQVPAVIMGLVVALNALAVILLLADLTIGVGPAIIVSTYFTVMGYAHATGRISLKK